MCDPRRSSQNFRKGSALDIATKVLGSYGCGSNKARVRERDSCCAGSRLGSENSFSKCRFCGPNGRQCFYGQERSRTLLSFPEENTNILGSRPSAVLTDRIGLARGDKVRKVFLTCQVLMLKGLEIIVRGLRSAWPYSIQKSSCASGRPLWLGETCSAADSQWKEQHFSALRVQLFGL